LKPLLYDTPNIGPQTGPTRTFQIPFDGAQFIHRRGGKFVQRGAGIYYILAPTNATTLAGYAETEQFPPPVTGLTQTTSGMRLPVNFNIDMSGNIPVYGRKAVEADIGRDFKIITTGNIPAQTLIQRINLNSSLGPLRVSEIIDRSGSYVAATIVPAARFGNL